MAFVKKIFKGGKDKKEDGPGEFAVHYLAITSLCSLSTYSPSFSAVNGVDDSLSDQTAALSLNQKNDGVEVATFALS